MPDDEKLTYLSDEAREMALSLSDALGRIERAIAWIEDADDDGSMGSALIDILTGGQADE